MSYTKTFGDYESETRDRQCAPLVAGGDDSMPRARLEVDGVTKRQRQRRRRELINCLVPICGVLALVLVIGAIVSAIQAGVEQPCQPNEHVCGKFNVSSGGFYECHVPRLSNIDYVVSAETRDFMQQAEQEERLSAEDIDAALRDGPQLPVVEDLAGSQERSVLARNVHASLLLSSQSTAATREDCVLFVDCAASYSGSGTLWETAYNDLGPALAHASNECTRSAKIYIRESPCSASPVVSSPDPSPWVFIGKSANDSIALTIVGGQSTSLTGVDTDNRRQKTLLQGSRAVRHVLKLAVVGSVTLERLVFTGGVATDPTIPGGDGLNGGGLYIVDVTGDISLRSIGAEHNEGRMLGAGVGLTRVGGSVTISDSYFSHNYQRQLGLGCGLSVTLVGGSFTLEYSRFERNYADFAAPGTGVGALVSTVQGDVRLAHTVFVGNIVATATFAFSAGAALIDTRGDTLLDSVEFINNEALFFGALWNLNHRGNAEYRNCKFLSNVAGPNVVGDSAYGRNETTTVYTTVRNSLFVGNVVGLFAVASFTASDVARGPAEVVFEENIFSDNRASGGFFSSAQTGLYFGVDTAGRRPLAAARVRNNLLQRNRGLITAALEMSSVTRADVSCNYVLNNTVTTVGAGMVFNDPRRDRDPISHPGTYVISKNYLAFNRVSGAPPLRNELSATTGGAGIYAVAWNDTQVYEFECNVFELNDIPESSQFRGSALLLSNRTADDRPNSALFGVENNAFCRHGVRRHSSVVAHRNANPDYLSNDQLKRSNRFIDNEALDDILAF